MIVVTETNMYDFISIPEAVIKKYKSGIIPPAHFSDMVRVCLLADYGGIWFDATVFLTGKLSSEILERPLFMFRHLWRGDEAICNSTWAISACKNHPVMCLVRDLQFAYWMRTDFLCDYFIPHIFFNMVHEKYPQYLNEMPLYSDVPPHIMQVELFHPFSESRWREIKEMSPIHKLTHKFDVSSTEIDGTVYRHIIETWRKEDTARNSCGFPCSDD